MGKDLKGKELGKGIGQSKDKRYYARFTDRCGHRSKPYYSFDLKEVKDWLLKQRYEDKLGKTTVFHEKITVKEAYELWYKIKKKDVRPQTLNQIRIRYANHIKKYELYRLKDINQCFVDEFMSEAVSKNLSYVYTNEIRSIFSQILNLGVEKGWCMSNPFLQYKYPKEFVDKNNRHKQEIRMTKFLTTKQQKVFLDYIDNSKRCHYKNLFKFLLYTGLRISEALALKWEHINFEEKYVFVTDNHVAYTDASNIRHKSYNAPTKSHYSNAILPLTSKAIEVLIELKKYTPEDRQQGLFFLNTQGKAINYSTFSHNLSSIIRTINKQNDSNEQLPDATPHFFRHTCAENFIEQGVHLTGLQYLMRHGHLTTTANSYGHTSYNVAKDAVEKYERNSALQNI